MNTDPKNPYVFPHSDSNQCMTLLDYYAGQILAGLLGTPGPDHGPIIQDPKSFVQWVYDLAEMMIEARKEYLKEVSS